MKLPGLNNIEEELLNISDSVLAKSGSSSISFVVGSRDFRMLINLLGYQGRANLTGIGSSVTDDTWDAIWLSNNIKVCRDFTHPNGEVTVFINQPSMPISQVLESDYGLTKYED